MSACYLVILKLKFKGQSGKNCATRDLNRFIEREKIKGTDFSLDKYKKGEIKSNNFEGLMKLFLAGHQDNFIAYEDSKGFLVIDSGFNASYSWEKLLIEMFKVMETNLQNGSSMVISIDMDYDELIIKNGVCVQTH